MGKWVILLALACSAFGAEVEFTGKPEKKIEVDEKGSQSFELDAKKKGEFRVSISKVGDEYFWDSRGNIPLVRVESGAYVTYVAVNGAGYIRVLAPFMREMHSKLSEKEKRESGYIYSEHLIHQLGSITYFGY